MLVKVEQRHIDAGERCHPNGCMVAMAVQETTGYFAAAYNDYLSIRGQYIDLPEHVREAIDKYDDGQDVAPFEFELELSNE